MISTDVMVGLDAVAPTPAVRAGVSTADAQVVRTAATRAPQTGTGLPAAGCTAEAVRLRTPLPLRSASHQNVPNQALRGFAVAGVPAPGAPSTPGDLPPDDPLS